MAKINQKNSIWVQNPILFGIRNGAKFRPQNRVMESPEKRGDDYNSCYFDRALSVNFNFSFQTI